MLLTTPSTSNSMPRRVRLFAVLALMALITVACGSSTSVVESAREPEVGLDALVPSADGPQYGDSVEEWTDAEEEPVVDSAPTSDAATEVEPPDDAEEEPAVRTRVSLGGGHAVDIADLEASDVPDDNVLPGFTKVEWVDLIEPGFSVEEIYARYEDELEEVEDGTPEANELYETMRTEFDGGGRVNLELDGEQIQLAGFVTPLDFSQDVVTEFLFVPTFGACIHVPAPPPNQTIMVTLDEGIDMEDTWGAVWIAGTLTVDTIDTDLATASYTLVDGSSWVYDV